MHLSANQAVVDAPTWVVIRQATTTTKLYTHVNVSMRISTTYATCCLQQVQPLQFNVIQVHLNVLMKPKTTTSNKKI